MSQHYSDVTREHDTYALNKRTVELAYWDAEFADAMYSKAIRTFFGEKATQWTQRGSVIPEVNAFLQAKMDADDRWLTAFRAALGQ